MRHQLAAIAVGAAILAVPTTAVACNDCGSTASGVVTPTGGGVNVTDIERTGGGGPSNPTPASSGTSSIVCVYYDVGKARASTGDVPDPIDTATLENGTGVWQVCTDTATYEVVSAGEVVWNSGGPPPVSPQVLAQHARAQIHLPAPIPTTWPSPDRSVVRVPVWLHVDNFQPASATATAGPVSATVSAAPVSVEWSFGDGQSITCAGAGAEYHGGQSASDCTHAFDRTSARQPGEAFAGSVSITWHLTWDSNVGDNGDLGLVVQSTPVTWRVEQIQSVITNEGTP